jgi:hypothetical protein
MYAPGRHGDVIVQIVSAPRQRTRATADDRVLQIYDALIYSQLAVPAATPSNDRYPGTLRNLPLRGVPGRRPDGQAPRHLAKRQAGSVEAWT